jgi:hypothetical protein
VTIFGLTGGALGNALTSLSGEAATGGQQAAFQIGNQFLKLLVSIGITSLFAGFGI